jgi:hypothetical protein
LQLHAANSTDTFLDLELAHPNPLSALRISESDQFGIPN